MNWVDVLFEDGTKEILLLLVWRLRKSIQLFQRIGTNTWRQCKCYVGIGIHSVVCRIEIAMFAKVQQESTPSGVENTTPLCQFGSNVNHRY